MNQSLTIHAVNKRGKTKAVPVASDERTIVLTETPTANALGYDSIKFTFDDDLVTIAVVKDGDVFDDVSYSYSDLIEAITGNGNNFLSFRKD